MISSPSGVMGEHNLEYLKRKVQSLTSVEHLGVQPGFVEEPLQEPLDQGPFEPGYPEYKTWCQMNVEKDAGANDETKDLFEDKAYGQILYDRYAKSFSQSSETETGARKINKPIVSSVPRFDSNFESGNLLQVIQIGPAEFELHLEIDQAKPKPSSDTRVRKLSPSRWFYFSVEHLQVGVTYTFHVTGFSNIETLYGNNGGCRPLFYSSKRAALENVGWRRIGENISYGITTMTCYTLSFSFQVTYDEDLCYFASCHPYTYSDLQRYLHDCETDIRKRKLCKRELMCTSLAGNRCDIITIGNTSESAPCMVFSARVHSGETCASWMIHGLIDFLLSESPAARRIRSIACIKIVPMLNPDGVICGTSRFSLAGVDLNRMYNNPNSSLHPTVFHFRKLLTTIPNLRFFCDFHGHSKKQNIFAYACVPSRRRKKFSSFVYCPQTVRTGNGQDKSMDDEQNAKETDSKENTKRPYVNYPREFVSILAKSSPLFSSEHSNFRSPAGVASSARVYLHRTRPNVLCMTLEGSLCGLTAGKYSGMHLSSEHFVQMGNQFGQALDVFLSKYLVPLDCVNRQ